MTKIYILGKSSQKPLQFLPVDGLLLLLGVCLLLEVLVSPVVGLLLVDVQEVRAVKHELAVAAPGENIGFSNPRNNLKTPLMITFPPHNSKK